jgi:hypothetical protein
MCVAVLIPLTGCITEDSGAVAARMEAQDDTSCRQLAVGKGDAGYAQCRQNLMAYRQQAQIEREQRSHNLEKGLQGAAAALQAAAPPPPVINSPTQTHCRPDYVGGMICNQF